MKRGKDEEKSMGKPMFPRLHVNDTEKGGPRAPPRNKMALYEQLSIPSQRFGSSGVLPLNPKSTTNMVLSASSSQVSGVDSDLVYRGHLPPSTPAHWSGKFQVHHSDVSHGNDPEAQLEQREKAGNDEDFMVPVFVQARVGQKHGRSQNSIDREALSSISSAYSAQPVEHQIISNKDPQDSNFNSVNRRQEVGSESNENMKAGRESENGCVISATDKSTRGKTDGPLKEAKASSNQQHRGHVVSTLSRSHDGEACLLRESRIEARLDGVRRSDNLVDSTRDIERGNASLPRQESYIREDHGTLNEAEIDSEYNNNSNRTCISSQTENADKGDDLSETSMVDSISGFDFSPDDVVDIIGQKHFWKARKAISQEMSKRPPRHQQRVFAVQVFELHRLIKVQRLIAGSPHLMLEDGAFLGKSSLQGSPVRKLPPEYVAKSPPHVGNCKDDSEKSNHKLECSAENAVGKPSLSSVKTGSQSLNYGPYVGNPQPEVVTMDNKMGTWYFHQSPGPQWLVPVMSPSEGLVYKPMPCPGPGLMGTPCGGYGPFSSMPMTGNFLNSACGIPASHHQGTGVPPGTSPVGHYFPPYGMPVINPAASGSTIEQVNMSVGPDPQGQTGPVLGVGMEQQSSSNVPTQKDGSASQARKTPASKSSDLEGSTASSPGGRAKVVGIRNDVGGRDPLQLFPTIPMVPEGPTIPMVPEGATQKFNQPTRVIKVVPHNSRSATESAARIFRFIQEERRQHDSV